jgi:hypothetical protein
LAEYRLVLSHHRDNPLALIGAGEAAFHLGRYRTAEEYLTGALKIDAKRGSEAVPEDEQVRQLYETSNMVLQSDPYDRKLSAKDRSRRIRHAFNAAGARLESCAASRGVDTSAPPTTSDTPATSVPANSSTDLAALKKQWSEMKPKVARPNASQEPDVLDAAMDIVFQIEQQTQRQCGQGSRMDQALLLLAQNRAGVDR